MPINPVDCWILTDGRAGNLRQARALAAALHTHPPREFELATRRPWRWLAPRIVPGARDAFGPDFRRALARPPAIAVGCGRQGALATRLVTAAGGRSVQILDPRLDPRHWDLVVAPEHDSLHGPNVLGVAGSLNPVDAHWLAAGREAFAGIGELPGPRTLLLLGGPVAAAPYGREWWGNVAGTLGEWQRQLGGSLLLSTSPRSPEWLVTAARNAWPQWPGRRWFSLADGPNPYPGLLGWADRIVVSPDSINLVSEAAASAAPVWVAGIDLCSGRQRRFLDALLDRGRVRELGVDPDSWPVQPHQPLPELAATVRQRLGLADPG